MRTLTVVLWRLTKSRCRDSRRFVYLDHNATTPVDRGVLDAMLPFLRRYFGNPSSQAFLRRQSIGRLFGGSAAGSRLLHAAPSEIIFTSGGPNRSLQYCVATTIDVGVTWPSSGPAGNIPHARHRPLPWCRRAASSTTWASTATACCSLRSSKSRWQNGAHIVVL